jgi:hypothetical protein
MQPGAQKLAVFRGTALQISLAPALACLIAANFEAAPTGIFTGAACSSQTTTQGVSLFRRLSAQIH